MKTSNKRVDRRENDIKKKLTAAVAMLLVSCIMVVTSTYAWFTLSTAPEVSGIQTTIAGNGNLEIALATKDTWTTPSNVATLAEKNTNIYTTNQSWGNLINVAASDTEDWYGVNQGLIRLAPAKLLSTVDDSGVETVADGVLGVPSYGADGRVQSISSSVLSGTYITSTGAYKSGSFNANAEKGFRVLGIASEMSDRQTAYNSAYAALGTNINGAKNGASNALQAGGTTLGSIAVSAAIDGKDKVSINQTEFATLVKLVDDTLDAVDKIEDAIIAAIDGYLASEAMQDKSEAGDDATKLTDTEYAFVHSTLNTDTFTIKDNISADSSTGQITVKYSGGTNSSFTAKNTYVAELITKYNTIRADVNAASSSLVKKAGDDATYKWDEIDDAVRYLMSLETDTAVTVSGYTKKELQTLMDEFKGDDEDKASEAMNKLLAIVNSLSVDLNDGSGIYYNIAELVGNITATNIQITVSIPGMATAKPYANITTTYKSTPKLKVAQTELKNTYKEPSSAGSAKANVISDVYAYALDLLFRTNADTSDLLLQTNAIDRIYSANTDTESDTFGSGSVMTFTKELNSFSNEKMLSLMNHIKIIFMDENNTVLAKAKLDTGSTPAADGTSDPTPNYTIDAEGNISANIILDGTDKICSLKRNTAERVSVLVYLDGTTISNADVANAATSMTATMNLQFSSSATLTPMEYKELYQNTTTYVPTEYKKENA